MDRTNLYPPTAGLGSRYCGPTAGWGPGTVGRWRWHLRTTSRRTCPTRLTRHSQHRCNPCIIDATSMRPWMGRPCRIDRPYNRPHNLYATHMLHTCNMYAACTMALQPCPTQHPFINLPSCRRMSHRADHLQVMSSLLSVSSVDASSRYPACHRRRLCLHDP